MLCKGMSPFSLEIENKKITIYGKQGKTAVP